MLRRGWYTVGQYPNVLLFGVIGDELTTHCHLLDRTRDHLDVRLWLGVMNECEGIAHVPAKRVICHTIRDQRQ